MSVNFGDVVLAQIYIGHAIGFILWAGWKLEICDFQRLQSQAMALRHLINDNFDSTTEENITRGQFDLVNLVE
jgi:hypothetical protein